MTTGRGPESAGLWADGEQARATMKVTGPGNSHNETFSSSLVP